MIDSEILAIHAALVATEDGGEVLYFGGDQHFRDNNVGHLQDPSKVDATRRFACRPDAAGQHRRTKVKSPTDDVFCSGHAFLPGGRLMVCGGTQLFDTDAVGGGHGHGEASHFAGHRRCWTYHPASGQFTEVAQLNPSTPGDEGGGRWYPTLVTLPSGELFVYGGHPRNDAPQHNPGFAERYSPADDGWRALPPTAGAGGPAPDLYPRLFLLPNGKVFCSSRLVGYDRCVEMDPCTGAVTESVALPGDFHTGYKASAVLLPLLPSDGYRARILVCGGAVAERVNLDATGEAAGWKPIPRRNGSAAGKERLNTCAVVLPTGQVLMTGGVVPPEGEEIGVNEPEIYTPAIDWVSGTYRDVVNPLDESDRWDTVEEPSPVVRNYHSTALLMPDGRVWTAGSSIKAAPGNPVTAGQLKIHIFSPPYPAGQRPRITDAPRFVGYGDRFTLETPDAATVSRVALLRCGAVTHAFDSDQRYVGVAHRAATASSLEVTAPASAAVAPPGMYMLFLVDSGGRPCEYARFVRLGAPSQQVFTDGIGEMVAKLIVPETSSHSPAVASDGARVFLAWTGEGDGNLNVMVSTDHAATFGGKHTSGNTSPDAPVLAVCRGDLFVAWTGEGDGNLNVALVEHTDTPAPRVTGLTRHVVLPETSPFRPALTADEDGNLYLAWTGEGDGNLNVIISSDTGATWRAKATFGESSDEGPAVAAGECGSLYLAWRGSSNEQLNIAQVALTGPPTAPSITGLMHKRILPDRSAHTPALASRDFLSAGTGPLVLGWTGEGAQALNLAAPAYTAHYRKAVFEQESSDDGPSLARHQGQLLLAWRGSGSEHLNVAKIARLGKRLQAVLDLHARTRQLIVDGHLDQAGAVARETIQAYRQLATTADADVDAISNNLIVFSSELATAGLEAESTAAAQAAVDVLRGSNPMATEFVDWTFCNDEKTEAIGSLGGHQVTLTGRRTVATDEAPLGTALLDGTSSHFHTASFTPPLPATDLMEIVGLRGGSSFRVEFDAEVKDPVFHLGSLASTLEFLDLPVGTEVTRLSGDTGKFKVDGNKVMGEALQPPPGEPTDSNGSVRLSGLFRSIGFTLKPRFTDGSGKDGVHFQIGGMVSAVP
ncbi:galactose oxidase-like domain-containing protein [Streptomyces sp. 21So2-11]